MNLVRKPVGSRIPTRAAVLGAKEGSGCRCYARCRASHLPAIGIVEFAIGNDDPRFRNGGGQQASRGMG